MNQKKSLLRQNFLEIRKNISSENKEKFSQIICKKILREIPDIFIPRQARNKNSGMTDRGEKIKYIALFAGMKDEVNLLPLVGAPIYRAQNNQNKIKFCFPKVIDAQRGEMEFFAVEKISDLEIGKFGILEPKKYCKKVDSLEISIFCVPAVSIDIQGNRIGMGGGFYDRYLAKVSGEVVKMGIIFDCQKSEEIFPTEKFDIPVDRIITEKSIF